MTFFFFGCAVLAQNLLDARFTKGCLVVGQTITDRVQELLRVPPYMCKPKGVRSSLALLVQIRTNSDAAGEQDGKPYKPGRIMACCYAEPAEFVVINEYVLVVRFSYLLLFHMRVSSYCYVSSYY